MKENKRRVAVTMTNENADKLAELAERMGVTSSQLAAVWLGQMLDTYNQGINAMTKGLNKTFSNVREP